MVLEFYSTTKCGAKCSISSIDNWIIRKKRIFISMIEHEGDRHSTSSFGFIESGFLSVDTTELIGFDRSAHRNREENQSADIRKFITTRTLSILVNLFLMNIID